MAAAALVCCVECVFVCVSVCVCVCVLLSPGRAGQTGPVHMEPAPLVSFVVALGVFPIGAWSVQYHAASSHSSSRNAVSLSPFCLSLINFSLLSPFLCLQMQNLPPFLLLSHPSMSFSVSLICFSSSTFLQAILSLHCLLGLTVPFCLFAFISYPDGSG